MATYYVRPTNGNDSNDGLSYANAWKTMAKAAASPVVLGDEIRLCAEATELPTATTTFNSVSGISLIGYSADGTTELDEGQFYTISGASTGTGVNLITVSGNTIPGLNVQFRHVHFLNSKQDGISQAGNCSISLVECRISGSVRHGLQGDNNSASIRLINSEVDHNGQKGLTQSTTDRLSINASGSRIHDNGTTGVDSGVTSTMTHCTVYRNGGIGAKYDKSSSFSNNVFFDNGTVGLQIGGVPQFCFNNSFVDNGTFGLDYAFTPTAVPIWTIDYNHYHGNESGETDQVTTPGGSNVSGDPLFANTTDGSEDFTPSSSSPLFGGGGINGSTIGPLAPAASGGSVIIIED
jgi:hypothetical protein